MNVIRTGWLVLLAAVPLAAAQQSFGQEPLGLSPVQRPFQSSDGSTSEVGKRFAFVCPASDGAPGMISWRTVWSGVPGDFVAPITVECPASRMVDGKIWGTDVYTRDSVICVAAVHAGAITAERGGRVVVTRARHTGEFTASVRNGVATERYGPFRDAFSVTAAATTPPAVRTAAPHNKPHGSSAVTNQPTAASSSSGPSGQPTASVGTKATSGSAIIGVVDTAPTSHTITTLVRNPNAVTATLQGLGDVVVSWDSVNGASWYGVAGATEALWRQVQAPATSITYQGLPPGQYNFSVGAYFEPGPESTSADEWPTATVTVLSQEQRDQINEALSKSAEALKEAQDAILAPLHN